LLAKLFPEVKKSEKNILKVPLFFNKKNSQKHNNIINMNTTNKGQASPNSHFFHVARLRDSRYHTKEVHGEGREAFFDNKQKAIQQ
ncbi:23384_t:CDS:2, partial [Racocetra persica]